MKVTRARLVALLRAELGDAMPTVVDVSFDSNGDLQIWEQS